MICVWFKFWLGFVYEVVGLDDLVDCGSVYCCSYFGFELRLVLVGFLIWFVFV